MARLSLRPCAVAAWIAFSGAAACGQDPWAELDAPADGVPPVVRVATSQSGSAAEAIPDVSPPPAISHSSPSMRHRDESGSVSLKKATGRFTVLAGSGNELGMDMLDAEAMFELRTVEGFSFGPSAGVVFLDGPHRTDLPPRLYTAQFDFRWFGQIATPVFYELAFMPAIFTDGENLGSDALRLQGRGVGYLAISEQTQFALGVTYLDRDDVPVLPIFGVLHKPRDDLNLEIVFPRPRILTRVAQQAYGETWGYLAGELGGGSWAIERQNGRDDIASYRDYRVLLGIEQRSTDDWTAAVEAGYVFGRELEYARGRGDYSPDNTLLLRLALSR